MIDSGFTGFLSFTKGMYVQVVRLSHLNAGTQYRLFFSRSIISLYCNLYPDQRTQAVDNFGDKFAPRWSIPGVWVTPQDPGLKWV
jgi:hypothetical protein